jgi:predicted GIY-YIG superfamily endonuclease
MALYNNDEINWIIKNIKIENEISKYISINKKNNYYLGYCPFHDDSKGKLYVNPSTQYSKCLVCGFSGNVIQFIQAYMKFDFKTAVQYLILENEIFHERYNYSGIGNVYVLRLINDKYYIGYTEHYCDRMHSHFSGQGSEWTKENKPVAIHKVYNNVNLSFENDLTKMYMIIFGYSIVRGGDYHFKKLKYNEVQEEIKKKTKEGVFILSLQDDKFYIGYGLSIDSDIRKHFNGFGCEWTKKYRPIKVLKKIRTRNLDETKKVTIEYINKYGWDNVRGYRWDKIDLKAPEF